MKCQKWSYDSYGKCSAVIRILLIVIIFKGKRQLNEVDCMSIMVNQGMYKFMQSMYLYAC